MGKKTELVKNSIKNAKPKGKTNWAYFWFFEMLPLVFLGSFIYYALNASQDVSFLEFYLNIYILISLN